MFSINLLRIGHTRSLSLGASSMTVREVSTEAKCKKKWPMGSGFCQPAHLSPEDRKKLQERAKYLNAYSDEILAAREALKLREEASKIEGVSNKIIKK